MDASHGGEARADDAERIGERFHGRPTVWVPKNALRHHPTAPFAAIGVAGVPVAPPAASEAEPEDAYATPVPIFGIAQAKTGSAGGWLGSRTGAAWSR